MAFLFPYGPRIGNLLKCVERGDLSLAEEILQTWRDWPCSLGYLAISEFQSNAGDFAAAQRSLERGILFANRASRDYFDSDEIWKLYVECACCAYLCKNHNLYKSYIEKAKSNAIDLAKKSFARQFPSSVFAKIAYAQDKVGDLDGSIETNSQIRDCF